MRYYRYLSKTKILMLADQLPAKSKKKVSAALGFDLGMLSGSISTERESIHSALPSLAEEIERHLDSQGLVGSIESDSPWARSSAQLWLHEETYALAFCSVEISYPLICLGGSSQHLIGAPQGTSEPASGPEEIQDLMIRFGGQELDGSRFRRDEEAEIRRRRRSIGDLVFHVVKEWGHTAMPVGVSFLAKRLLDGRTSRGLPVFVGTPLYVCLD